MKRTLTEAQVLKKLDITDFRHLTKEKVISMATMLDKMDPEVAKKALEQFPEFSSTMKQIFSDYKQVLDEGMKQNADSVKSYYETCDAIIATCQKELDREDLAFEERCYILDQMLAVAKMKGDKNSEDKRFIIVLSTLGGIALTFTAGLVVTALGGNCKINTDALKKLSA